MMGYNLEQHCCTSDSFENALYSKVGVHVSDLPGISPLLKRYTDAEAELKKASPAKGVLERERCDQF